MKGKKIFPTPKLLDANKFGITLKISDKVLEEIQEAGRKIIEAQAKLAKYDILFKGGR